MRLWQKLVIQPPREQRLPVMFQIHQESTSKIYHEALCLSYLAVENMFTSVLNRINLVKRNCSSPTSVGQSSKSSLPFASPSFKSITDMDPGFVF